MLCTYVRVRSSINYTIIIHFHAGLRARLCKLLYKPACSYIYTHIFACMHIRVIQIIIGCSAATL